jgi:hypothetical protein
MARPLLFCVLRSTYQLPGFRFFEAKYRKQRLIAADPSGAIAWRKDRKVIASSKKEDA